LLLLLLLRGGAIQTDCGCLVLLLLLLALLPRVIQVMG
jgi:hypothetical protein